MRGKSEAALRALAGLLLATVLLGFVAVRVTSCAPAPKPELHPVTLTPVTPPPRILSRDCYVPGWQAAARINQSSLSALAWNPFGRDELGWRIYAPLIAREIGVACEPASTGFAKALADWQEQHGFQPDGLLSQLAFQKLKTLLQSRRAVVQLAQQGVCALPADERELGALEPAETYGDKLVQLRPGALQAYRRMVAAARAEIPAIAADPDLLKVFSGYRSPAYDAARCEAQGNCNGRERAVCSPHRTGLAMDINVGSAPGYGVDSSADPNRLAMVQGAAYRWLVLNADRYGFVNYPFEPWHWEWTGEAPRTP